MGQPGRRPGLAQRPPTKYVPLFFGQLRRNKNFFNRNRPTQELIPRAPDDPHATAPEPIKQAVTPSQQRVLRGHRQPPTAAPAPGVQARQNITGYSDPTASTSF